MQRATAFTEAEARDWQLSKPPEAQQSEEQYDPGFPPAFLECFDLSVPALLSELRDAESNSKDYVIGPNPGSFPNPNDGCSGWTCAYTVQGVRDEGPNHPRFWIPENYIQMQMEVVINHLLLPDAPGFPDAGENWFNVNDLDACLNPRGGSPDVPFEPMRFIEALRESENLGQPTGMPNGGHYAVLLQAMALQYDILGELEEINRASEALVRSEADSVLDVWNQGMQFFAQDSRLTSGGNLSALGGSAPFSHSVLMLEDDPPLWNQCGCESRLDP